MKSCTIRSAWDFLPSLSILGNDSSSIYEVKTRYHQGLRLLWVPTQHSINNIEVTMVMDIRWKKIMLLTTGKTASAKVDRQARKKATQGTKQTLPLDWYMEDYQHELKQSTVGKSAWLVACLASHSALLVKWKLMLQHALTKLPTYNFIHTLSDVSLI